MKVFEACCIVIKRRAAAFVLYFVIFITLCVVMTSFSVDRYSTDFSEMKPNFTVINRDEDTPLSRGLISYLREHGTEVVLEDRKDVLQDATFYHASDYIVILPEGFHASFAGSEALPLQTVTTPDSAKGYYADSLVNQYLSLVRTYQAMNPAMDEEALVASVLKDLTEETRVEKKQFGASQPVNENFEIYSRMESYIILVLVTLCISTILMVFRRPDLNMRNLCSPMKPRSMSGQLILCGSVVSFAAWLVLTAAGFLLYGSSLAGTDGRIIALIVFNTFIFMLVALALAMLAGSFIRNSDSQNAVANFLSLSLCFLGGAFVPLEMLGKSMLAISRFTPTYWYTTALDQICDLTSFSGDVMAPIWQAMLIQLGFAVAIICVALVINKYKNQSEKSFGSIQTEREA